MILVALYLRIIAAACVAYVGFSLGRRYERADMVSRIVRRTRPALVLSLLALSLGSCNDSKDSTPDISDPFPPVAHRPLRLSGLLVDDAGNVLAATYSLELDR